MGRLATLAGALLAMGGASWFIYELTGPMAYKLAISVNPDDVGCDPEYPVGVTLRNRSFFSTAGMARFEVSVRQSGYSTILEHESFETEKLIGPRREYAMCVRQPSRKREWGFGPESSETYEKFARNELTYSAKILSADRHSE